MEKKLSQRYLNLSLFLSQIQNILLFYGIDYFNAKSNPAFFVVLGIIDTKFYGFKGPRLYTARGGKIAKEAARFEPSHDPSAISEDASFEDAVILPRA